MPPKKPSAKKAARSPSPRSPSPRGRGCGPSPPRREPEREPEREHEEPPPQDEVLEDSNISFKHEEIKGDEERDQLTNDEIGDETLAANCFSGLGVSQDTHDLSTMTHEQFEAFKEFFNELGIPENALAPMTDEQRMKIKNTVLSQEERLRRNDSLMTYGINIGIAKSALAIMTDDQREDTMELIVERIKTLFVESTGQGQDRPAIQNDTKPPANNDDEKRRDITVSEASKYLVEFQRDHAKSPPIVEELSGGEIRLLAKEDGALISLRGDVWRALGRRGQLCLWALREDLQKGNGSSSGRGGNPTEKGSKSYGRQKTRITEEPEESAPKPSLPPSSLPGPKNMDQSELAVMFKQLKAQSDSMARAQALQAQENARIMELIGSAMMRSYKCESIAHDYKLQHEWRTLADEDLSSTD